MDLLQLGHTLLEVPSHRVVRGLPENIMIKSGLKIDEITGVKMHSNRILAKSGP